MYSQPTDDPINQSSFFTHPVSGTHAKKPTSKPSKPKKPYPSRRRSSYALDYRKGRKTHKDFKDLHLVKSHYYNGYRVLSEKGPLVESYLQRLIQTVVTSYLERSKVFSLRVDLYFPRDWTTPQRLEKDYYGRFIDSLNQQMKSLEHKLHLKKDNRDLSVRHFRALEIGNQGRGVHIHALLMFNGHQFQSLGDITDLSQNSLGRKILSAWGSALFGYDRSRRVDLPPSDWRFQTNNSRAIERVHAQGLVHFGKTYSPSMHFDVNQRRQARNRQIRSLVLLGSYLCKAETKSKLDTGSLRIKNRRHLKWVTGCRLPAKGLARAEKYHRYQIQAPLYSFDASLKNDAWYQPQTIDSTQASFDLLEQPWQPDPDNGPYIATDLSTVTAFIERQSCRWYDMAAIEVSIRLPLAVIEAFYSATIAKQLVKGLEKNFIKPLFSVGAHHTDTKICALFTEEVTSQKSNAQRYLKMILMMPLNVWQKLEALPGEQFKAKIADEVLIQLGALGPADIELSQPGIWAARFKKSKQRFEHILQMGAELARSHNKPKDLSFPFLEMVP